MLTSCSGHGASTGATALPSSRTSAAVTVATLSPSSPPTTPPTQATTCADAIAAPASTTSHTVDVTVSLCSAIPAGAHLWIVSVAGGKYYAKIDVTASGTYPVALASDTKVGGSRTFEIVEATTAADETWLVSDHDNDGNQNFARATLHGTVVSNSAPNTYDGSSGTGGSSGNSTGGSGSGSGGNPRGGSGGTSGPGAPAPSACDGKPAKVTAPAITTSYTVDVTATLCTTFPAGAHLWIVAVAGGKYYSKVEFTASGTFSVTLASDTKVGGSRTFEIVEATTAADESWLVSDHDNDGNQNFARTTLHGTVVSNAAPDTFSG